jgi:hypothetical protein
LTTWSSLARKALDDDVAVELMVILAACLDGGR